MGRRDFGRYKIAEEVGRGAMGVVYRATDPVVRRTVAIKAINTNYLEAVGVKAAEFLERFHREAEVAGRLSHPGIVKIYDLGPDYIVMEFVQGQSLASLLHAKVRLAPDHILDVVSQVADALDYAHGRGVVHRDIKPGNIMLQPHGEAKVMDFGLARVESSTLTAAGEILGSASYMAPEVVLGRQADARSDIFSLGVVAYEMVTGDRPFGGGSISVIIQNIVRVSPRSAHQINLHLPPEYDAIFERVLSKDPAARFATALEFANELALRKWAEPAATPPTTDDGAATIPPGSRQVFVAAAPPAGRTGGREEADPGSQTVLTVDAGEMGPADDAVTLPPGAVTIPPAAVTIPPAAVTIPPESEIEELPAESLEPIEEDDAPLGSLVSDVPTETQPPGSQITAIAREAASERPRNIGASEVLSAESPATTPVPPTSPGLAATPKPGSQPAVKPTSAMPPKKGASLVVVAVMAAALLLALAFGLSVVAYRMLVRRAAATAASPSPAAQATLPATPDTTPPAPPDTTLPATPDTTTPAEAQVPTPEPMATPEAEPVVPSTTLAPALAALSVSSEPAGAKVVVGRRARGVTPLRLQLPPGRVSIAVEKEGFKPWKKDVTLPARGLDVAARLEAVPSEPAPTPTPAGVRAGDLVPLGPGVTPPRRLAGESPRLSDAVTKLRVSGSVLVEFIVDEEGRVTEPKIVESGAQPLDAACLEAVKRWRYEPATTQGVKVKVVQRAKFTFQSR